MKFRSIIAFGFLMELVACGQYKVHPYDYRESKRVQMSGMTAEQRKEKLSSPREIPSLVNREPESAVDTLQAKRNEVVEAAKAKLGARYKYGSPGPDAFDCSGFTSYIYLKFGVKLKRSSRDQFSDGVPVDDRKDLQPGDLVFFNHTQRSVSKNLASHVGLVTEADPQTGTFRFIHSSTSHGVIISNSEEPYYKSRYMGARRVIY